MTQFDFKLERDESGIVRHLEIHAKDFYLAALQGELITLLDAIKATEAADVREAALEAHRSGTPADRTPSDR